jgi:hypothetical protein
MLLQAVEFTFLFSVCEGKIYSESIRLLPGSFICEKDNGYRSRNYVFLLSPECSVTRSVVCCGLCFPLYFN